MTSSATNSQTVGASAWHHRMVILTRNPPLRYYIYISDYRSGPLPATECSMTPEGGTWSPWDWCERYSRQIVNANGTEYGEDW